MSTKRKRVIEAAARWQQCRADRLSRAFYAYDTAQAQSERLVSFRLGVEQVRRLVDSVVDPTAFTFVIHLGLGDSDLNAPISDTPAFRLFLQAYNRPGDWQRKCEEAKWLRDSKFSSAEAVVTQSGLNAIPAASAYLFIYSWLELPEQQLAKAFTATSRILGERVQAYRFSKAESESIYLDMQASLSGTEGTVDIHLGNGVAVYAHPFSFRPVLEIKGAINNDANRRYARDATGLTDEEGASYYDFGGPIPPGPKEEDA